jgi:tRNA pseudouridine55 synthase
VLVLDKPTGMSSAHAVETVKRAVGAKRAGHGGTLDPIATGVLPICLDAATKLASYLLADDKEYEATGVLGIETDTLDRTGIVTRERAVAVTEEALLAAIAARRGEQDQIPPMFSAIKQGGVRLYQRARAGEEVERAPRRIRIDRLELLAFEPPRFRIAIACSKGTYVRSLVADLGTDLGCGAHLAELRRTRSGMFSLASAVTLDGIPSLDLAAHLVPCGRATNLPSVVARAEQLGPIRDGLQLPVEDLADLPRFQILDEHGRLVAIAHAEAGKVLYDRVFPADATS